MIPVDGGSGGDKKGMEDGKVKDIAGRLQKAKADLAAAKSDADAAAQKLQGAWHGPDATRFQGQWKKESNHIDQCVLDVTAMVKSLEAHTGAPRPTPHAPRGGGPPGGWGPPAAPALRFGWGLTQAHHGVPPRHTSHHQAQHHERTGSMGGDGARKGMDADKVRSIADRLSQAQRTLADAASSADTAVRVLRPVWTGGDAKTFFNAWPGVRDSLEAGALHVESLQRRLREELGDQEQTSGVGGGGGDRDRDGIPDGHDRDRDNDNDNDNDGTPDGRDTDDDNDGTSDAKDHDNPGLKLEWEKDQDGDGEHRGEPKPLWENEWVDNNPQHKGDPRVPVDVSMQLGGVEKQLWDASVYDTTFGDEDGNHLSLEALSTEGKAEGTWSIDGDGLTTAGTLTAGAYLAKASGAWSNSYGTAASGSAYVGAEGNAKGSLSLGLDGMKASAGGEVFVGGKAEASINQDFGPVDAGVGGEISYGVGAHAEADAEFSADRVGVSVDIGATLGIGGGVEFDIGFDPPW